MGVVDIKFCGLTRAEDAEEAEALGAAYLGGIFAGGPRNLSIEDAARVFAGRGGASRVGVFASPDAHRVSETAHVVGLHVLQIHADASGADLRRLRAATGLEIWSVVRVGASGLPAHAEEVFEAADAVVLDTHVRGVLGGTGKTFDWSSVAESLDRVRGRTRLVLAGGLTPENVAEGIATLSPDVVDVSSGVERSPGLKDHARMREFAGAVRGTGVVSR